MPPKKSTSKGGKKSKKKKKKKKSKTKLKLSPKRSHSGGESDSQTRGKSSCRSSGSSTSAGTACFDCPLPPPGPSCRRSKNTLFQQSPSCSQSAPSLCPTQAALSSPSAMCPPGGAQVCTSLGRSLQPCQSQAFLSGGGGGGCRRGPGPSILSGAGPSMMGGMGPSMMGGMGPAMMGGMGPSMMSGAGPSMMGGAGPSMMSCAGPSNARGSGSCGGFSMMTTPSMMSCGGASIRSSGGSCTRPSRTRDAATYMTRDACTSSQQQAPIIVCSPSQLMLATIIARNGEIPPSLPSPGALPSISASPGIMYKSMNCPPRPPMMIPPRPPPFLPTMAPALPPHYTMNPFVSQHCQAPRPISMGIQGCNAQMRAASYHQMMPQRCQSLGQIQNYFPPPQSNMPLQPPPYPRQLRQVDFQTPSIASSHPSQYSLSNVCQQSRTRVPECPGAPSPGITLNNLEEPVCGTGSAVAALSPQNTNDEVCSVSDSAGTSFSLPIYDDNAQLISLDIRLRRSCASQSSPLTKSTSVSTFPNSVCEPWEVIPKALSATTFPNIGCASPSTETKSLTSKISSEISLAPESCQQIMQPRTQIVTPSCSGNKINVLPTRPTNDHSSPCRGTLPQLRGIPESESNCDQTFRSIGVQGCLPLGTSCTGVQIGAGCSTSSVRIRNRNQPLCNSVRNVSQQSEPFIYPPFNNMIQNTNQCEMQQNRNCKIQNGPGNTMRPAMRPCSRSRIQNRCGRR